MTTLTLDIETDDINPTKLWCASYHDGYTGMVATAINPQEVPGLSQYEEIVGHNIIKFDGYYLNKLWGVPVPEDCLVDTVLLSKLYDPNLPGGHSLKSWGKRLDNDKGDFTDFTGGLSAEMIKYCEQDVLLTVDVYNHLKKLLKDSGFSQECIDIEHRVALICAEQERNGFLFDQDHAAALWKTIDSRMDDIEIKLQEVFPPIVTERYSEKTGNRLKDDVEHFNPGSRIQIANRLKELGVKFKQKTETGREKVDETVLAEIDLPEAQMISEYMFLQKRSGMLDQWFSSLKEDGRVHGRVDTIGAVTNRMTHSGPNMAQIPGNNAPYYGKECRQCWIVPEGHKLVGIDASGLELRMLAHYMKDEDYTNEVVNGDVHTKNQKAADLPTRSNAKTFIYAFLYGAGDAKIGSIVGGSARKGGELRRKFLANTPALSKLKDLVAKLSKSGSLPGLDGRRLRVRSEHSALNTLLQGAGAIVMKWALVYFYDALKSRQIPFKIVANVHDEWQVETPEEYAEEVGKVGVWAIEETGRALKLRCPLTGEYHIGDNWSETH